MHLLVRTAVPTPTCLVRYHHGRQNWDQLRQNQPDYEELCTRLDALQGGRCAYCERSIGRGRAHVEHFVQKRQVPQATFQWDNLFWSCMEKSTCGLFKDRQSYAAADLLKPDVDDGDDFLRFDWNGGVAARRGLTPRNETRALTTIKVFNLDAERTGLKRLRLDALAPHKKTAATLVELAKTYSIEDLLPFIEDEVRQTRNLPFATAIKHILTPAGALT